MGQKSGDWERSDERELHARERSEWQLVKSNTHFRSSLCSDCCYSIQSH